MVIQVVPTLKALNRLAIEILLGGRPDIQAIIATLSFVFAHAILYVLSLYCEPGCDSNEDVCLYHPELISSLAALECATSLYQSTLIVTLISMVATIQNRYRQVERFMPKSIRNKLQIYLGVFSSVLVIFIFNFDVFTWPLMHTIIAFTFFTSMTIYICIDAGISANISRLDKYLFPKGFLMKKIKIFIAVLSAVCLIIQIALLIYKRHTNYHTEWRELEYMSMNRLVAIMEWIHVITMISGVLCLAFETMPHQMSPTQKQRETTDVAD